MNKAYPKGFSWLILFIVIVFIGGGVFVVDKYFFKKELSPGGTLLDEGKSPYYVKSAASVSAEAKDRDAQRIANVNEIMKRIKVAYEKKGEPLPESTCIGTGLLEGNPPSEMTTYLGWKVPGDPLGQAYIQNGCMDSYTYVAKRPKYEAYEGDILFGVSTQLEESGKGNFDCENWHQFSVDPEYFKTLEGQHDCYAVLVTKY